MKQTTDICLNCPRIFIHRNKQKLYYKQVKKHRGVCPCCNPASVFFSLLRFFSFAYAIQKKRNEDIKKVILFSLILFFLFCERKNNKQNIFHPFFSVKNGWSPRKLRPVVSFSQSVLCLTRSR